MITATNRIQAGGRIYPRPSRIDQAAMEMPLPFPALLTQLEGSLPFVKRKPTDAPKAMVEAFMGSLKLLDTYHDQWHELLMNALRANVEVRTDDVHLKDFAKIHEEKVKELSREIPKPVHQKAELLDWDLMANLPDEIHGTLAEHLKGATQQTVHKFLEDLETLVDKRMVGLLQYHPRNPKVCKYEFFRAVVIQQYTGTRQVTTTRDGRTVPLGGADQIEIIRTTATHRDHKRTHRHARHEHQLYNVKPHPWNCPDVNKPSWIAEFVKTIPHWLRPHIQVIEGDMIKERIVEHDTREEHWTETETEEEVVGHRLVVRQGLLYSPAVVIAHFTLTGWGDLDFKRDDSIRRNIPIIK